MVCQKPKSGKFNKTGKEQKLSSKSPAEHGDDALGTATADGAFSRRFVFSDFISNIANMGGWRNIRTNTYYADEDRNTGAYQHGEDSYSTDAGSMMLGGGMMAGPVQAAIAEGILVTAVMSGMTGQPIFSQQTMMTGLMAGIGVYVLDMYAPRYTASAVTAAVGR